MAKIDGDAVFADGAPRGYGGQRRSPEEVKREGWREQRVLAVSLDDDRLTWPERELIRQLGDKLYGKRICATRLSFMRSLNIWKTFGRGWARRVADIEAKGVAWALTAANDNSDLVKQQLGDEADKARSQAGKQAGAAAGAGGGGVISLDQGAQLGDWILAGIAFVAFAALAFLIIRAVINTHRATAYAREAPDA